MDEMTGRARRGWPILLLIWLPLSLALAVAIAQISGGSPLDGIRSGTVTGLLSFALGLVVWGVTAWVPWTERAGWRFFGFHLAAALSYSVAWWGSTVLVTALVLGNPPVKSVVEWWQSDVVGWNVMVGLAVYGLAAGISYAIRLQWRLQQEQLSRARADAAARAAQLAAVEARLDPHFLFNTLHSVAALVRTDPERAENAIDSLGDLLRDAFQERSDLRTLAEEWQFTERYLELERLRLDERLRVVAELTPEALQTRVPPLMLQSLVENAIRHGISKRPEGGTVRIDAHIEHGALMLSVKDDGVGASTAAPGGGLGLSVLRARLLERKPPGTVSIETEPDRGFRVLVALPGAVG